MQFTDVAAIETLLRGREPSIEEKLAAKAHAWSNGMRPKVTKHVIHTVDARNIGNQEIGDVHLVVTSPPYFNLIQYKEDVDGRQLGNLNNYTKFLDELDQVWKLCHDCLVPGGRMCVVVGDVCIPRRTAGRHHVIPLHADIATRCRRIGFDYLTPILWAKIANMATEVGGAARFLGKPYEPNGIIKNDIEYILMLRKPGRYRKPTPAQRALSVLDPEEHSLGYRSIWNDVRGESRTRGHPAPFPVALAERLIRLFSFVGDTVLDPFSGSGTTTVAAIQSVRSSIGLEIEPSYVKIAKDRVRIAKSEIPSDIKFI